MKPALILIDLQNDYLAAPGLEPAAGRVIERAAALLHGCRRRGLPVVHVVTTVRLQPDSRMPHWKSADRRICVAGTAGHAPPEALRPIESERIVNKQYFSGFGAAELSPLLRSLGIDTLILAGVHLHACVRATALDGYQQGYRVWIADDAVAGDDAPHAAITRRYLVSRAAGFRSTAALLAMLDEPAAQSAGAAQIEISHRSRRDAGRIVSRVTVEGAAETGGACLAAQRAGVEWRGRDAGARAATLRRLAQLLDDETNELAHLIADEVGKPIAMARGEVRRSAALLHATADHAADPMSQRTGDNAYARHQPLGVVAIVTPWNNPLAIPIGKIAPALLYGNTAVWKPSPLSARVSRRLHELGRAAGWSSDGHEFVRLCMGDHSTAAALGEDPRVDGLTLSGSLAAGHALQEICVRRHIPFQGELGGNNGAIVWDDADLPAAAAQIAAGAFGFAGQRCTANRRAIVSERCFDAFVEQLRQATGALAWGDPLDETTVIGPLIHSAKRDEIAALLERARAAGMDVSIPHADQADRAALMTRGAYHPPAIVLADDAHAEIVQEESFGPVLVVQRAGNFDDALELLNGVRQGLVAALFSDSPALRTRFLADARAGVLKLNMSTVDADATSPLGGWKASGVGPAEHGDSDREFFCRVQTIYGHTTGNHHE